MTQAKQFSPLTLQQQLQLVIVEHYSRHQFTSAARAEVFDTLANLAAVEFAMIRDRAPRERFIEDFAASLPRKTQDRLHGRRVGTIK